MTATLRRRCASHDEARRLAGAVAADNPAHLSVIVHGAELTISAAPAAPASVRATLDDLLACLQAAERTAEVQAARPRARSPAAR